MKINLSIIPDDGQTWLVNNNTAELNEALRDLIGANKYKIEFTIRPLAASSTFELRGTAITELPEECSRCGLDFRMPIDLKFNHLLMPSVSTPRDAKFSKTNHFSDLHDTGLEIAEYYGETFNADEFFHELIALAEPFTPAPPEDKSGKCTVCHISVHNHNFGYTDEVKTKQSPFASLKGVKITPKN